MAFQSIPQCAEAVIMGTLGGKSIVNVLGFDFGGPYGQTDIQALADAVDGAVGTGYLPTITGGASYDQTLVRGLENVNDFEATQNASTGVGGVGGASLPNNVTLCITLRSALTGRSARGRFYAFPTGAGNLASANTFSTTYGDDVAAFLTAMKFDASSAGWNLAVLSRFALGVQRPTGVAFRITSIGYRNLLCDSQRGRLPIGH